MQVEGHEKHYLCIDLQDTNNSIVMVPQVSLQDIGLREAISNIDLVREIMFKAPRSLDDHYRTRQANIRERIEDGGIRQLIQGLRDLCWREYSDRLTNTDRKLRKRLQTRLQREISIAHDIPKATARKKLATIIEKAMLVHADKSGVDVDD